MEAMGYILCIIWLILTVFFLLLGVYFWLRSRQRIQQLNLDKRLAQPTVPEVVGRIPVFDSPIIKMLGEFVDEFNKYIDDYNRLSSKTNIFAACSFFLAGLTSLVALVLEIMRLPTN